MQVNEAASRVDYTARLLLVIYAENFNRIYLLKHNMLCSASKTIQDIDCVCSYN